jgi:type IV pilus assembly protein PilA
LFINQGDRKMKRIQKGFTLIELMIVVAIVGILAAIALPAYQDFIVRSKMSEALAALAACKTSVSEYVSAHGGTKPTMAQSGCASTPTQYLASLDVAAGVISATSQNTGAAAECTLILTPLPAGVVVEITSWTPTFGTCASKYVPSSFR